jgi:hypothetical protein
MEQPYPGNFGDVLNPYIVEKLSGIPPAFGGKHDSLLMIGSTIKFASAASTVWGTGTSRLTDTLEPTADYRAVRGPLTRDLVLRSGGRCPDIYGDCAAFLPLIYMPAAKRKRHRVGLIRHTAHHSVRLQLEEVKEISIFRIGDENFEKFVDEIVDCEVVLSSSLHGLIVAHAYGVPAVWCDFADRPRAIAGDGTKFHDYFASIGLHDLRPVILEQFEKKLSQSWIDRAVLPKKSINLQALASVAPFQIRLEVPSTNLLMI